MHGVPHKVLDYIRREELFSPGDRVGVAVSGGIDSVAMLRALLELRAELGIVLSVLHLNHKLRGADSDADEVFVAGLARAHGLELQSANAIVADQATAHQISIETAARRARYDFFVERLGADPSTATELDKVATGHTLDDQAETVLMRVIRGTGMHGLAAIRPRLEVEDVDGNSLGQIVRPLLDTRRTQLERYLKDIGQCWREDSTNRDPRFTRNRVRAVLLPLLEHDFNPAVAETLSELAEISYGEEDFWHNEIEGWMGTRIHWMEPDWAEGAQAEKGDLVQLLPMNSAVRPAEERASGDPEPPANPAMNASVDLLWLLGEPLAVQRRVVKAVGEYAGIPLEFKHVEAVLRLARDDEASGKKTALPLGWQVLREPESLLFSPPRHQEQDSPDYEHRLPLPGRAIVPEANIVIEAIQVRPGVLDCDADHALDRSQLPGELTVRNWRPGDRFWPAHTKAPKKVKELLQDLHLPQSERRYWPVIVSGTEIVWVYGFPGPAKLRPKDAATDALMIRVSPMKAPTEVEE